MRLLILSFYYQPDLSAGSFRTTALVTALRHCVPPDAQIDVLTTMPNRYHSYARAAAQTETEPGLEIHRIRLPSHRSDMRGQSLAFARFARAALAYVAGRDYDLVYATSSRLMTATLGAWIARRKRARLYLDVRDIFSDTVGDLLPAGLAGVARAVFARVEAWTMHRADRINLVSPGFVEYFRQRYGERSFATFTNGVDDEFLTAGSTDLSPVPHRQPITILYAGNVGEGQMLHLLLPALARALGARARLVVIGDGGRRQALEEAMAQAGTDNVELRPPMARAELMRAYQAADVLLLHLGAYAAFEKVLPSKVFEYAAMGKPILAGVGGYAARFIRQEITNAAIFAPCDAAGAVVALDSLTLVDRLRPEFVAKYARSQIAREMAADLLAHAVPTLPPT